MSDLARHTNGMLMDLSTTLPNGRTIITRWPPLDEDGQPQERFVESNQIRHVEHHLEQVEIFLGRPVKIRRFKADRRKR